MCSEDPLVVRLVAEGFCLTIHGHQEPDGSWRFMGTAMNLDLLEDGNDAVRVGSIPRCRDLSEALPDDVWIKCIPSFVHPELRGWFRDRYDSVVASLSPYARKMHEQSRHGRWQAFLDSTPPDPWSDEDVI